MVRIYFYALSPLSVCYYHPYQLPLSPLSVYSYHPYQYLITFHLLEFYFRLHFGNRAFLFRSIIRWLMDRERLSSVHRLASQRLRYGRLVWTLESRIRAGYLVRLRFRWQHRWRLFGRVRFALWIRGKRCPLIYFLIWKFLFLVSISRGVERSLRWWRYCIFWTGLKAERNW